MGKVGMLMRRDAADICAQIEGKCGAQSTSIRNNV